MPTGTAHPQFKKWYATYPSRPPTMTFAINEKPIAPSRANESGVCCFIVAAAVIVAY